MLVFYALAIVQSACYMVSMQLMENVMHTKKVRRALLLAALSISLNIQLFPIGPITIIIVPHQLPPVLSQTPHTPPLPPISQMSCSRNSMPTCLFASA
jgi:hypothetical protein